MRAARKRKFFLFGLIGRKMNSCLKFLRLSSVLFLFIIILFFSNACSPDSSNSGTPTTPIIPKKAAILNISVNKEPIVIVYSKFLGYGLCEPKFTATETNGVGVNIQIIKVEFIRSNGSSTSINFSQRRLEPYGSFTIEVTQQLYHTNYSKIRLI